jgi:hypothetical protein
MCDFRKGRPAALTLAALVWLGHAEAADFNSIGLLNQAEFRAFSEDLAAAVSYKPMIPSEGLGITGFDLGLSASATAVAHRDVLRKAAGGGSVPDQVPVVGARLVKGLPFDIDIGVVGLSLPDTNVEALGGELRWAFIGGNAVVPAVALRVSTMSVSGVDGLKMRASGADLSISKGFAPFTPYAGVGIVDVRSSAPGSALAQEDYRLNKSFVGLNIALAPLALVLEADKTGDATSFGIKVAVRW